MSLAPKIAQLGDVGLDLDGEDVVLTDEDTNDLRIQEFPTTNSVVELLSGVDDDISIVELPSEKGDFTVSEEELHSEPLILTLDLVPGGADQDEIELQVEESDDVEITDDPWAWTVKGFLQWLSKKMQGVPSHSGRDTVGLERAIAYLEQLNREISRAVRADLNNEIAIDAVEKARDEIKRGIDRLEDRLDKINNSKYPKSKKKTKKAEFDPSLVKEGKATHVGGIVVSVPLFISYLARVMINGMVSGGHDIEDMFKKLDKKFKLTDREKAELMQLLMDMNYPVRRDRGFLFDEEMDFRSSDNFDFGANYDA